MNLKAEYVVSAGEGTLLYYGVAETTDDIISQCTLEDVQTPGFTIMMGVAAPDCETGQ